MTAIYAKTGSEVRRFTYDWSDQLGSADIVTSTWVADTGVTIVSSSFTAKETVVTVSGGTNNQSYLLTNTVTTNNGQTYQGGFVVRIIPLDSQSVQRRVRLRNDIGDLNTPPALDDSDIEDLWLRAKAEYSDEEVAFAYLRILAIDLLLGSAAKQHSYSAGSVSENLSELFNNLRVLREQFYFEWQRLRQKNLPSVRWGGYRYKQRKVELPDGG